MTPPRAEQTTTSGPVVCGDEARGAANSCGVGERRAAELPDLQRLASTGGATGLLPRPASGGHRVLASVALVASSIARRTAS